jgi:hypothetical protein
MDVESKETAPVVYSPSSNLNAMGEPAADELERCENTNQASTLLDLERDGECAFIRNSPFFDAILGCREAIEKDWEVDSRDSGQHDNVCLESEVFQEVFQEEVPEFQPKVKRKESLQRKMEDATVYNVVNTRPRRTDDKLSNLYQYVCGVLNYN